jgi:hypothetical protein
MGLRRRGPDESWNIARSTRQVTISPTRTEAWPAARAMSFWAREEPPRSPTACGSLPPEGALTPWGGPAAFKLTLFIPAAPPKT